MTRGVDWIVHPTPSHRSARRYAPRLLNENPTEVQAEDDEHDTPKSVVPCPPEGLGVRRMRHLVPSQPSASVPRSDVPVVRQAEGEVQDTPHRDANPTPGGLGLVWRLHAAPSHRSTRVCTVPAALCVSPVAVQAEGEMQDTPLRKLCTAPAGFGVGWMVHAVPSQRSARVSTSPELSLYAPAAMQTDADGHDTAPRPPPSGGVGEGMIVHAVPSHRSARVDGKPTLSELVPTAMQAEGPVQAPPLRPPPGTVGLGRMLQVVPSHRSISGVLFEPPTATQFEPDRHATPASWPDAAPVGSAVCWMVHAVPSHPSPRVTALPALSPFVPTAMQEEAVGQARPNSQL